MWLWDQLAAVFDYAQSHLAVTLVAVFVGTLALSFLHASLTPPPKPAVYKPRQVGDITEASLLRYGGRDPSLPLCFAIRGKVLDVSEGRDFYGPGSGYSVFAGREAARALAKMSLREEDCSADLEGLTKREQDTLRDWEERLLDKYSVVGQVVPERELTLKELAQHDGSDPDRPLLLAIRGTVFDITPGKEFYGPDGVYPFAGRECARAFALVSTDEADCSDDLEGLGAMELESLRDWEGRFWNKYRMIGRIVS